MSLSPLVSKNHMVIFMWSIASPGATCCAVDLVRQKRQEAAELLRTLVGQEKVSFSGE